MSFPVASLRAYEKMSEFTYYPASFMLSIHKFDKIQKMLTIVPESIFFIIFSKMSTIPKSKSQLMLFEFDVTDIFPIILRVVSTIIGLL